MVTEGWELEQFFLLGPNDSKPPYGLVNLYIRDPIEDGIPLYKALKKLKYRVDDRDLIRLTQIKSLIDGILGFTTVALVGIVFLAGASLLVFYAQTIKKKEKEIGALLAKGISRILLRSIFLLEVTLDWVLALLFALPVYWVVHHYVENFVRDRIATSLNLDVARIFAIPGWLWPAVAFGTLLISLLAVYLGIRKTLRRNVANILRSEV